MKNTRIHEMPVQDKLKWLEEINDFNELFLGKKEKEIREKLKQDEFKIEPRN